MSLEDIRYVERLAAQNTNPPAVQRRHSDNDDQPLALKQTKVTRRATMSAQPKKPQTYWFEFFLNAGCDIDDCTRYASSFKREKIDEAILPDITKVTLFRITKCIQQKFAKPKKDTSQEQLIRDEELARKLQEEEVLLAFMDDRRTREAQVTGRRSPSIDWEAATYPSPPPSNVEIPGIGHVLSSSDPVVDEPPPYVP
ncbi:uncharacterized protein EDB91DRAFT_1101477 [Suillus paluster]|uniref:uncharacterized protein n=1 Tax=Suillus paluster TaxID=48578 RepID=UPI001B864DDF|nr:uncharacterized protein EDB91DRAFT_1101477 [Suillus paluster]KAG1754075.1 hypothetical protein EDB91DRAFT_1101477 [Suillus paluster]